MGEPERKVATRRAVLTAGAATAAWAAPVVVASVGTPAAAASKPPPAGVTFINNTWTAGNTTSHAFNGTVGFYPQWQLKSGSITYQVVLKDSVGNQINSQSFTMTFTNTSQQSKDFKFSDLTVGAAYTVSVLVVLATANSWLENGTLITNPSGAPVVVTVPGPISATIGNW